MIEAEMPQFKKIKISSKLRKDTFVPVDNFIYEQKLNNVAFYLHFLPLPDEDSTLLEAYWSESFVFPAAMAKMFTGFNISEHTFKLPEAKVDFENCYHRLHGRSPKSWDLWTCKEPIPSIDLDRKDDPEWIKSYKIQFEKFKQAYIAEAIWTVTEEEAMENTRKALANMASDIKECVFPIFEEKLLHVAGRIDTGSDGELNPQANQ